ncbi:hypothetical protein L2E82_42812 [Cichorium intybus]|uniref:Uncharacterized protein n=1 Tax=Cichorium intybus TaxID=13427 RepID=A0ACB8ZLN5_CICIN|nr:hypothetical protein L2E82_42812 [Cichorium intybus]
MPPLCWRHQSLIQALLSVFQSRKQTFTPFFPVSPAKFISSSPEFSFSLTGWGLRIFRVVLVSQFLLTCSLKRMFFPSPHTDDTPSANLDAVKANRESQENKETWLYQLGEEARYGYKTSFWSNRVETFDNLTNSVKIAMVGKYGGLTDFYFFVVKALLHACIACSLKLSIEWIAASNLEDESAKTAPEAHTKASETLRISVIEMSRSILSWKEANGTEFDEHATNPVVTFMPKGSRTHMGNTMRLGSRRTLLQTSDCITAKLYQNPEYVDERHRHPYEVNPEVVGDLEKTGLRFVGKDESGQRMEAKKAMHLTERSYLNTQLF